MTLDAVAQGDPVAGAALAQDSCVACHDPNGLSADPTKIPSTTGQSARALYKQLSDMKRGERLNDVMKPLLEELSQKQLADLLSPTPITRPLHNVPPVTNSIRSDVTKTD